MAEKDELKRDYDELTKEEVRIWDKNKEKVIWILDRKREIIKRLFELRQK